MPKDYSDTLNLEMEIKSQVHQGGKMNKKRFLTILLLVLGIIVGTIMVYAAPSGTLSISWPETFRSIDPHRHDNQRVFWAIIGANLFDHLTERTATGDLVPGLATSWEQVQPTVWEFHLRQGVEFHNGEPFTAEAVKYTFERMVELTAPCLYLFTSVESVEIINDYVVRIHTTTPYGALPNTLTMAEIVPPVAGREESFNTHPVGTGPFMFEEWVKGEKLSMVANPNYWGGEPLLERVIHYPIIEAATRAAAVKTGQIDIAHVLPVDEVPSVRALSTVDVMSVAGNDTIDLVFDHDTKFADYKVRLAIALAIDNDEIDEFILGEAGIAAKSIYAPPVFGFVDIKHLIPGYDPVRARELLAEAGYPSGFTTNITLPGGFYTKDREIVEYMQAKLGEVGITLEINYLVPASAWPVLDSEDFELFFAGWAAMPLDGDAALYRNFHSSSTRESFADPVVDLMIEVGRESRSADLRAHVYHVAQTRIIEELLRYPIYHPARIYAINTRVQNFVPRGDEVYELDKISVQ